MQKNLKLSVLSLAMASVLTGCSTVDKIIGNDDSGRDYDKQLVKELEIPKNLFNPARTQLDSNLALEAAANQAEQKASNQGVPSFSAENLSIESNLSERWLEISGMQADAVWNGLKKYLVTSGFQIEQERIDIGILKTNFIPRTEIVPASEMGPLTKLLNSWRPEVADGVLDKFVVRVEQNPANQNIRVYLNHSMMVDAGTYTGDGTEGGSGTSSSWKLRPYSPVIESEALYQLMVFFGSSSEQALSQVQISENRVEIVDGDEFNGLKFDAGVDESWTYVQAMIYRADWNVESIDTIGKSINIRVPDTLRGEESLFNKLAFWKESARTVVPEVVKLKLSEASASKSLLMVSALEGEQPLKAEQRKYLFESLGFLAK